MAKLTTQQKEQLKNHKPLIDYLNEKDFNLEETSNEDLKKILPTIFSEVDIPKIKEFFAPQRAKIKKEIEEYKKKYKIKDANISLKSLKELEELDQQVKEAAKPFYIKFISSEKTLDEKRKELEDDKEKLAEIKKLDEEVRQFSPYITRIQYRDITIQKKLDTLNEEKKIIAEIKKIEEETKKIQDFFKEQEIEYKKPSSLPSNINKIKDNAQQYFKTLEAKLSEEFGKLKEEAKNFGVELTTKADDLDGRIKELEEAKKKIPKIKELDWAVKKLGQEASIKFLPRADDLDGRIEELEEAKKKIPKIKELKENLKRQEKKFKMLIDIKPLSLKSLKEELTRLEDWNNQDNINNIKVTEDQFQEIAKKLGIKVDLYKNYFSINVSEITKHLEKKIEQIGGVEKAKEEAEKLGIKITPKKCKELFESEQALEVFKGKIESINAEKDLVKKDAELLNLRIVEDKRKDHTINSKLKQVRAEASKIEQIQKLDNEIKSLAGDLKVQLPDRYLGQTPDQRLRALKETKKKIEQIQKLDKEINKINVQFTKDPQFDTTRHEVKIEPKESDLDKRIKEMRVIRKKIKEAAKLDQEVRNLQMKQGNFDGKDVLQNYKITDLDKRTETLKKERDKIKQLIYLQKKFRKKYGNQKLKHEPQNPLGSVDDYITYFKNLIEKQKESRTHSTENEISHSLAREFQPTENKVMVPSDPEGVTDKKQEKLKKLVGDKFKGLREFISNKSSFVSRKNPKNRQNSL